MNTTNYGENCNQCKMTVSFSAPRKKVIYHDNNQNQDYHPYLTDDQIDLLEWMTHREYILDGSYDIIEDIEFITI